MRHHASSTVEDKALALLGTGVSSEQVASALGVSASRISQLLSGEDFSSKVTNLRYAALSAHSDRDREYDEVEDSLLGKLKDSLPLMFKPSDILRAIAVINGAKRRGVTTTGVTESQNIVNLVLPTVIAQKFTVNINNQVTKAGEQELLTLESSSLLKEIEAIDRSEGV